MVGGELLLTSLNVFEKMSEEMFLFHLEELNKKKISGFIIKRNESIPSYLLDTLFKFCEENHIPVLEISQNQNIKALDRFIDRNNFRFEALKSWSSKYSKILNDEIENNLDSKIIEFSLDFLETNLV